MKSKVIALAVAGVFLVGAGIVGKTYGRQLKSAAVGRPIPPPVEGNFTVTTSTVTALGEVAGSFGLKAGEPAPHKYWYEGLSEWNYYGDPYTIPMVKKGTVFYVWINWTNDGTTTFTGHVSLRVTKPDGTTLTAPVYKWQDQTLEPGEGHAVLFQFTVDQLGTYTAKATLSEAGTTNMLDEWQGKIVKTKKEPVTYYTYVTDIEPSGSGTITGEPFLWEGEPPSGTIAEGEELILNANPKPGWNFVQWTGDISTTNQKIVIDNMSSDISVTAHFEEEVPNYYSLETHVLPDTSAGRVTPSSGNYEEGTEVSLRAVPSSDLWRFDHWERDVTGTSNPVTVTMNSDKLVHAVFERTEPVTYDLTTSVSPSGAGTVSPSSGTYEEGTEVELTANPASGYEFQYWGGDVSGTSRTTTVTMTSDKNVVANFVEAQPEPITYTLDVSKASDKGSVGGSGTYDKGTEVSVTASPYQGYAFDYWTGDYPAGHRNDRTITVVMDSNKSLTAHFKEKINYYTLKVNVTQGKGKVYPRTPEEYREGKEVTLNAVPASGYRFVKWSGAASGSQSRVTVIMDSDKTVEAKFAKIIKYSLSVGTDPQEGGTVKAPGGRIRKGEEVTLTAYPNKGYRFVKWTGAVETTEQSITLTMDSDKNLTAHFEKKKGLADKAKDAASDATNWMVGLGSVSLLGAALTKFGVV